MITILRRLIEALNDHGIRYCHWKSNLVLAESLSGQTDVDLLIHRADAPVFRILLSQLCFRPSLMKDSEGLLSIEHYFALDDETGILAHVHVYYRVITGESLAKNYRFPIEAMLLRNTREIGPVRVPTKSAELIVFTLRMMLKHTSLVELALLARDRKQMQKEVDWLMEGDPLEESMRLVDRWLPSVDPNLFSRCVDSLKAPAPLLHRVLLALRLRSRLRMYSRRPAFQASLIGIQKFTGMFFRRLVRSPKSMVLQSGGAVIAFVGPEATGKSTLLAEANRWLGEHFAVRRVHAGKPRSTLISAVPNLLVPALRSLLPRSRSGNVETQYTAPDQTQKSAGAYPLIFALRSALLAYDRRSLLSRAYRAVARGTIVFCDRYPSLRSGASDSPQLAHLPLDRDQYPLHHLLARLEERWYRQIPPPDLIILLTVPVEVAVRRNAARGKHEPEDYVRRRHAQSANLDFGETPVYRVNTDQPLEQTVLEIKKAIWKAL